MEISARNKALSLHSPLLTLRALAALSVGVPATILVVGYLYSLTSLVRGGHYGTALALAGVECGLLHLVFRLGAVYRCSLSFFFAVILTTAPGIPMVAHVIHYGEVKSSAWRHLQEIEGGRPARDGESLDRNEAFRRYVGRVTEREGDGAWAYLRLQAAIGWEGYEGLKYRTYTVRSGSGVWLAWVLHVFFFLVAGALAMGATVRHSLVAEE